MLSLEYVKEHIGEIELDDMLNERRFTKRFIDFLPSSEWEKFGYEYTGEDEYVPKEWTEENVLFELKDDLDFAIEKAINHRGISASLMNDVLKSWCIVLENGLDKTEFGWYGDKLIKAIDEYYDFGLYHADTFAESRVQYIKGMIIRDLHKFGYRITDFCDDGMIVDLDGTGTAKITISKME